jgi:hypothetical protein
LNPDLTPRDVVAANGSRFAPGHTLVRLINP